MEGFFNFTFHNQYVLPAGVEVDRPEGSYLFVCLRRWVFDLSVQNIIIYFKQTNLQKNYLGAKHLWPLFDNSISLI